MKTTLPAQQIMFYTDTMLARPVVVLISGKAGTGKSTTAYFLSNVLARRGLQSIRGMFADGVKDCAERFFGWDRKKDEKGRKLLQNIGNTGRMYNEDIWVANLYEKLFLKSMFPPELVIIDDWRFPNEAEFFKKNCDCIVLKLKTVAENREMLKGTDAYNDISEISLDDYHDFDFVFDNSGTESELYDQIDAFILKFFTKENKN